MRFKKIISVIPTLPETGKGNRLPAIPNVHMEWGGGNLLFISALRGKAPRFFYVSRRNIISSHPCAALSCDVFSSTPADFPETRERFFYMQKYFSCTYIYMYREINIHTQVTLSPGKYPRGKRFPNENYERYNTVN
jgi:hypothetical protein